MENNIILKSDSPITETLQSVNLDNSNLISSSTSELSSFTNLRAYRNEYTPAVPAFCVITANNCHLFLENCRINKNDVTKIATDIRIHDLKDFKRDIANILKNVKIVKLDKKTPQYLFKRLLKN